MGTVLQRDNFPRGTPSPPLGLMTMAKRIVKWIWLRYYTALWLVRINMWNPIPRMMDRFFEEADWQVRIRVGRFLNK